MAGLRCLKTATHVMCRAKQSKRACFPLSHIFFKRKKIYIRGEYTPFALLCSAHAIYDSTQYVYTVATTE